MSNYGHPLRIFGHLFNDLWTSSAILGQVCTYDFREDCTQLLSELLDYTGGFKLCVTTTARVVAPTTSTSQYLPGRLWA